MSIVTNENEWAQEMIKTRTLGRKPFETMSRVARYYIDQNYTTDEVRQKLDGFLLQCNPTASLPKWSDMLDKALARAVKHEAIEIDNITVTEPEIRKIRELDSVPLKRLAFTLLCLAKYWNEVNPGSYWVNTKDSEIMNAANIKASTKRQSQLYHTLEQLGYISFSMKVDNTNIKVCFSEEGETALLISDFRNLGYQFMLFEGSSDYIRCQNCGLVVRKNNIVREEFPQSAGRPQKYCKLCATQIKIRRKVDSVMHK